MLYSVFASFFPTFHIAPGLRHRRPDPTGEAAAPWEVGGLHGTAGAQVRASALAVRRLPARASQWSLSSTSAIHREKVRHHHLLRASKPPRTCTQHRPFRYLTVGVWKPQDRLPIILLCRVDTHCCSATRRRLSRLLIESRAVLTLRSARRDQVAESSRKVSPDSPEIATHRPATALASERCAKIEHRGV